MPMLTETIDAVVGVDTHTDTHTASLHNPLGAQLGTCTMAATPDGYTTLLDFAATTAPGPRIVWAIEGTGSHGTGLARALAAAGQQVIEADRPTRRGRAHKSDPADAARAALAALAAEQLASPRADGIREALRVLLVARDHAAGARRDAVNTLKALVLTAPDHLREPLRALTTAAQVRRCAALRAHPSQPPAEQALRRVLRELTGPIRAYDRQLKTNHDHLAALVQAWVPALLELTGVGPVTAAALLVAWSHPGRFRSEAAFAALTGAAPIEASSGRVTRHRLNRGGDRQANRALHVIAMHRARHDPTTRAYVARRRAEGKSDREIRRLLKRYLARKLFRIMETHG